MPASIDFVIGNTYERVSNSVAKLDRTKTFRKVHDWTLYVDFRAFNDEHADLVQKVIFDLGSNFTPSEFVSYYPIKTLGGPSKNRRWRFATRQQTYGQTGDATIIIVGKGGTTMRRTYRVKLTPGGAVGPTTTFVENRPYKSLVPVPMADIQFGIELELSTSFDISHADVANLIESNASVVVKDMTDHHLSVAHTRTDVWRLVSDASLQCNISSPNCNTFELVSPILQGGGGLGEVDRVMRVLGDTSIKINTSMGFHVHVNVNYLSLPQLKNVCQNFVKYEAVMDKFMPKSRRNSQYCLSNRLAFGGASTKNSVIHDMIASCTSINELGRLVSPTKYYKLNMQPLITGRQPTIEFRQHSGTYQKDKVKNWIRFCVAFVHNSAKLKSPSCLSRVFGDDDMFDMLFMYVVKDRSLRDFYRQRREDVATEVLSCCDGCSSGGGCEANSRHSKLH